MKKILLSVLSVALCLCLVVPIGVTAFAKNEEAPIVAESNVTLEEYLADAEALLAVEPHVFLALRLQFYGCADIIEFWKYCAAIIIVPIMTAVHFAGVVHIYMRAVVCFYDCPNVRAGHSVLSEHAPISAAGQDFSVYLAAPHFAIGYIADGAETKRRVLHSVHIPNVDRV